MGIRLPFRPVASAGLKRARVEGKRFYNNTHAMNSFCFRPGFYVQQLTKVPAGTFDVIPSTFYPGQEGPFIMTIAASCKIALARK